MRLLSRYIALGLIFAALAGCGGGGGSGSDISTQPLPVIANPDTFYIADQDTDGVDELYQVDSTNPGVSRKLNSPLVSGGEVTGFTVSADGSQVVYRADQITNEKNEIFFVNTDNPGVSVKLNADLISGADVSSIYGDTSIFSNYSPDGRSFYYLADPLADGTKEVYKVELDTPGVATRMSSADVSGLGVTRFMISHNSNFLVYLAAEMGDSQIQLFRVDVADPGNAAVLNLPLDISRDVKILNFHIRPDDQTVIYSADQDEQNKFEIQQVYFTAGQTTEKVTPVLPAFADAQRFRVGSDGQRIFYLADQETDGVRELYQVYLSTPGTSYKVNGGLVTGGEVSLDLEVASDNSFVVYRANQDDEDFWELYRSSTSTPGVSTKLNGALTLAGDRFGPIYQHALAADDETLIFLAEKDTAGVKELYQLDINSPGISTKISGPLSGNLSIDEGFKLTEDGSRVVYRVSPQSGDGAQLFQIRLDIPGVASRINSPLVTGGNAGGNFGLDFTAL
jgi:hypothetical protein